MSDTTSARRANLVGIALITLAMFAFAIEDALIKLLAQRLATGHILLIIGIATTLIFASITRARGESLFDPGLLHPAVAARLSGELFGTAGFVSALAIAPLSMTSAIIQATPLVVTMGAALTLGEKVGPRRWTAVVLGLLGVLIILRPGGEGSQAGALLAVLGVIGLSIRDVATRRIPASVSTSALATYGCAILVPTALLLFAFGGELKPLTLQETGLMGASILVAVLAYYAVTAAMRVGDISAVTPFRYTRLIFALPIGYLVFSERPDLWTYVGATIIVGSGLYVLWREAQA